MWKNKETGQDENGTVFKESLLRQLSHTVKEVQLFYSQSRETCSTQEGVSSLVTVLEAVFLHGLKRGLLESAFMSVSGVEDERQRPKPSFYNAVSSFTHKGTIKTIAGIKNINSDVGRCRAWIRLALNDAAVSTYLSAISTDKRFARSYRPFAFLRDKETLDMVVRLIDGLLQVPFDIPLNSSLLNTWSTEPLLLAGLWTAALRPSVQMAVDVAGIIEDDDESVSEMTASSSMRSLLTLDDSQAMQMIMNTNIFPQEVQEEDEMQPHENVESALERSFSYIMENCSPQPDPFIPPAYMQEQYSLNMRTKQEEITSESATIEIEDSLAPEKEASDDNTAQSSPEETRKEEDFQSLLTDIPSSIEKGQEYLDNLLVQNEIQTTQKRNFNDVIMAIAREADLRSQNFQCCECNLSIGLKFGPAFLCHVTGENLCEGCHGGAVGIVPARLIFNWDYAKYPIGKNVLKHFSTIEKDPMFNLEIMNPKLYSAVHELRELLNLRKRLNLLHVYLTTCKEPIQLSCSIYLLETAHVYSLADLIAIPSGTLKTDINKWIAQARRHVVGCWMCKQKGFICELCKDPQVIYPFDEGSVYRCSKCKAVYHGLCLARNKICPKCRRRKEREAQKLQTEE